MMSESFFTGTRGKKSWRANQRFLSEGGCQAMAYSVSASLTCRAEPSMRILLAPSAGAVKTRFLDGARRDHTARGSGDYVASKVATGSAAVPAVDAIFRAI